MRGSAVLLGMAVLVLVSGCASSSATSASFRSQPSASLSASVPAAPSTTSMPPTLTAPPLGTVPTSYAPGVEFTIDPSDKADPQDSSEVEGFNWWPGFGPNGSLGVYRWLAIEVDGTVYTQDWDLNGNPGQLLELSCNGTDEIEKEFSVGGRKSVKLSLGDITGDCPNITAWNYMVSQVEANDWPYNVVK